MSSLYRSYNALVTSSTSSRHSSTINRQKLHSPLRQPQHERASHGQRDPLLQPPSLKHIGLLPLPPRQQPSPTLQRLSNLAHHVGAHIHDAHSPNAFIEPLEQHKATIFTASNVTLSTTRRITPHDSNEQSAQGPTYARLLPSLCSNPRHTQQKLPKQPSTTSSCNTQHNPSPMLSGSSISCTALRNWTLPTQHHSPQPLRPQSLHYASLHAP